MTLDPTDLTWAIQLVRSITRDATEPFQRGDLEIATLLAGTSFLTTDDVTYYRPHVAAAAIVRSDPTFAISESIDNASQTVRDPEAIARGILRAYAWVDDVIERITGEVGFGSRTFRVVF